jgi:hypothetical protein
VIDSTDKDIKEVLSLKMNQFRDLVRVFARKYNPGMSPDDWDSAQLPILEVRTILKTLGLTVSANVRTRPLKF